MSSGRKIPAPPIPGRSWFDAYSLHAQWAPVLSLVSPVIFATYMVFPALVNSAAIAGGGLLVAALPPMLAHTARNLGKRLEPGLWAEWGGKPTTRLLRHRDTTLSEATKHRYFLTLEAAGITRPSPEEEATNPTASDRIYESAGDWLRRQTRDPKRSNLVSVMNASYGLARNLFGLKWIGFGITAAVGLASASLAFHAWSSSNFDRLFVATAVNFACAVLWLLAVNRQWVRSAAEAYALALLECLEPGPLADPPRQVGRTSRKRTHSSTSSAAPVVGCREHNGRLN